MNLDLANLCFIDTETRSTEVGRRSDITKTSAKAYARQAKVIIVTYAIGDGPVQEWVLTDFTKRLAWADAPQDLIEFRQRATRGEAFFVAFNAAFDRYAMNGGIDFWEPPLIAVEEMLDAAVLAASSNLPGNLEGFSRATGGAGKLPDGKRLIQLFCPADGATPRERPNNWALFVSYAREDVEALRAAWKVALPVDERVWREYWAAERVNDRGLPLDIPFVTAAAQLADEYLAGVNEEVSRITGGKLYSIKQHAAMAEWVFDRVAEIEGARDAMTKTFEEESDEGGELIPAEIGLDRHRVRRLIAMLEHTNEVHGLTDDEAGVLALLRLREYGASATPGKFGKMLMHEVDERLPGQYLFAGAQQTGRFSSRGVQMHNMTRDFLPNEEEVIAAVMECRRDTLAEVVRLCGDAGKALALTVRPAIAARKGRTMLWGDWSNIEARVLPFLAGEDPVAEAVLDVFRAVDRDPVNNPDVYCLEASKIERWPLDELWDAYRNKDPRAKKARQKGKIAVLSLGFGGADGALQNMAANYGMVFPDAEAKEIVSAWREGNPWAKRIWKELWSAFLSAMGNPGVEFRVGRLVVIGTDQYIGHSTVFVILPDGRPLVYPDVRWQQRKKVDKRTGEVRFEDTVVFAGQYGYKPIWYGTIIENATQGTAASLLRAVVEQLESSDDTDWPVVCGHTHDEVITEVLDTPRAIELGSKALHREMTRDRGWTDGLPLAAEISHHWYYTKAKD